MVAAGVALLSASARAVEPPAAQSGGDPGDIRIDGLSTRPPDRVLVFVVRGEGVRTPVLAFQERARRTIEAHLNARIVSLEEAVVLAGSEFQHKLSECRGDDSCYARLVGSVQASYLLLITASRLGDQSVVGSRFLDLAAVRALGNAVDVVPEGRDVLDMVPERIRASVPPEMWDPFGFLSISVDVPGAELSVNGHLIGVAPVRRVGYLLPGVYRVAGQKGEQRAEVSVQVARREDAKAVLELQKAIAEGGSSSSWLWWVIGGAVLVGGGVAAAVVLGSGGSPSFCSAPDRSLCNK
jgi:hypothetical protein